MKKKVQVTIKTNKTLFLPTLPNFIRSDSDDPMIPIEDLSQEQLTEIGKAWTDALLQHAKERRKLNIRKINDILESKK